MSRKRALDRLVTRQRFFASSMLAATGFGVISSAIAGVWPAAITFGVCTLLFLGLVIYGIKTSEQTPEG
jgi:hypothetical protein